MDTSVMVSYITNRNTQVDPLMMYDKHDLFINEYVVKEIRRVLKHEFQFSDFQIELTLERILRKIFVLPTPSKNEARKVKITDKSDRPIVCSAMKHECVLVTEDRLLQKEAGRYVRTMLPKDIPSE